jgi:hypothetical protein
MNAAAIRAALRRAFPAPDYAIGVEVAHATGHKAHRHLDMVIMDTWPSRGLELMGIEIKVSPSDLARELAMPEKSEQIARYCNSFWLATPKDLVKDPSKLPFSWGLLEVDEAGKVARKIGARRKDGEPITKEFVAALMRGACRPKPKDEIEAEADAALAQIRERLEADFESRVERASSNNDRDARAHRELREKLGDQYRLLNSDSIVRALDVVIKAGLHESYGGLNSLAYAIQGAAEQIDEALVAAGFEPISKLPKRKRL